MKHLYWVLLPEPLGCGRSIRFSRTNHMPAKTYAYHRLGAESFSAESLRKIAILGEAYSDLHDLIEQLAPASRERSVGITELETSAMWTIKAVVCNDPESVVEI
ncbi:MAG: DUF7681 family protein [Chthoniobacterales bacterium]